MRFAILTAIIMVAIIPSDIRSQEVEFTGPPLLIPDAGVEAPDAGVEAPDAGVDHPESKIDAFHDKVIELGLEIHKLRKRVPVPPSAEAVIINDVRMPQRPHTL
jgi:hypothetical protein